MKLDTFHRFDEILCTQIPDAGMPQGWRNGISFAIHCSPEVQATREDVAIEIRKRIEACHGLELPENVPPGILKEIVENARSLIAARKLAKEPAKNPRQRAARIALVDTGKVAMDQIARLLEKLGPFSTP